jgi:hypothetical protein
MRDRSPATVLALAIACLALAHPARAQEHAQHQHDEAVPERLGQVAFDTSCAAAVKPAFDRATALLHSFAFRRAIEGYDAVLRDDPSCGMAAWGIALASWGNPFAGIKPPAVVQKGAAAATRATSIGAKTPRERDYIAAAAELYREPATRDHAARTKGYADAMARLAAAYPGDEEARIFSALAALQTVPLSDKTYAIALREGAALEALFATRPDHPGIAHYIIHAYDVPALAPRALEAARRYAQIAPSAPHALHMPSHTFTRVGYWRESIASNIASADAARAEGATAEELHAMDYLAYAYLQLGRDGVVGDMVAKVDRLRAGLSSPAAGGSAAPITAGSYASAAIPARYALERGDWAAAAALAPVDSAFVPSVMVTHFARGLGAARAGRADAAASEAERLAALRDRLKEQRDAYWADQAEIQRLSVSAWTAWAQGRKSEALDLAASAARAEDATDKAAISPGPLAPARELLAEMLMEAGRFADARREFEAVLGKEPGRLRSLFGAGLAAEKAGDTAGAALHYQALLAMCEGADEPARDALVHARAFIAGRPHP